MTHAAASSCSYPPGRTACDHPREPGVLQPSASVVLGDGATAMCMWGADGSAPVCGTTLQRWDAQRRAEEVRLIGLRQDPCRTCLPAPVTTQSTHYASFNAYGLDATTKINAPAEYYIG